MADIGERKLATIRRIGKIEPIEGADRIVKATIDGWELVTQKGNYKPGDLALYFEIDAFLPVREEFEFLRKGCYKAHPDLGEGFRIRTIKLKGQVSQGLSLPLKDFLQETDGAWWYRDAAGDAVIVGEGSDLTEWLGVQKYEKLVTGVGSSFGPMGARGTFPDFIPKTDQERVQNCLGSIKKWIYYGGSEVYEVTSERILELLEAGAIENTADTHYFKSGDQWYKRFSLRNDEETIAERQKFEATLKLDGSSMTVYHNDGRIGVCSRNQELTRNADNAFWRTALDSEILAFLIQEDGRNLAVQGELMGPGVQGNREELETHGFYIFDVYLIDEKRYMTPDERDDFLNDVFGYADPDGSSLNHVPSVNFEFEVTEDMTVADFLVKAERSSINHAIAEGVVFKSHVLGGPSFKAISNRFLLAEKD